MRILFVVQRYGREIFGGAEHLCREYATRLAQRGHKVSVLTSRALSYVDWADHYPLGDEVIDGVIVHRLGVVTPRCDRLFNALNTRVVWGGRRPPLYLQEEWIRAAGPRLDGMQGWLRDHVPRHDVVVFFTYLYWSTWAGLPLAAAMRPTVFHPTAHDEPPLQLPLFESTFRHPAAFGFLTEEEAALVNRRFGLDRPSVVVGVGVDLDETGADGGARFRAAAGLGDRPYLICVGRVDAAKGAEELFDFFRTYKERRPGRLALALVGDPARPLPQHPDVRVIGTLDEATKRSAISGAVSLVQPSFYESFSMVLSETWALRQAALVQGHCDVLAGRARRSGGAIPYRGYAEFETAVDRLTGDDHLRLTLGAAGRRHVEAVCGWAAVMERYEELLRTRMPIRRTPIRAAVSDRVSPRRNERGA